jgi:hypothetical protein
VEVEVIKAPRRKPEEKVEYSDNNEPPVEKKTLLIGTVFMNDSEEQLKWFDLQMRYFHATTPQSFDHVTFLQDGATTDLLKGTKVINAPDAKKAKQSKAHIIGLNCLLDYFKKHQENYEDFLFIDSDAFPIRKDWHPTLRRKMVSPYEIAAVIRPENLEQRLHSSVLLARKQALPHLKFTVGSFDINDLCGYGERDVCCGSYQGDRRKQAFPLLKSNRENIHPLLCSVYYDMFYHNGCGTGRDFNMRARPYWNHMVEMSPDVRGWINQLMKNPNEFIGKLAGWNPEEYPEV